MFALAPGLMLGLWDKQGVAPTAPFNIGGSELAFALTGKDGVDAMYADCCKQNLSVAQKPMQMDFGYTFVVLDPDGHRLRVFTPTPA